MANNFFVAYDLMSPGQNYDAVREAIANLGPHYQFQFSLFYLSTYATLEQAHHAIRAVMDLNDRLCVIDATGAWVSTYPRPTIDAVNFVWHSP